MHKLIAIMQWTRELHITELGKVRFLEGDIVVLLNMVLDLDTFGKKLDFAKLKRRGSPPFFYEYT